MIRKHDLSVVLVFVVLNGGLGERDPQVRRLGQLVVMHFDERVNGVVDGLELNERHLAVFGEELEGHDGSGGFAREGGADVVLVDGGGDIGEMESGGGRVDVAEVLGARLLEAVQR